MLRVLGVWNLSRGVLVYLVLATVFLVVGFLVNIIAWAVQWDPLFLAGTVLVVAGAGCGLAAAVKAGRSSRG